MNTKTLFCDKSDLYAKARPQYPEGLFEYVNTLTKNFDFAWDCATGNGQAALGLARYFKLVEATDISESQIANAITADNIRFSIQEAEKTDFRDNQFDMINVSQALHWFDLPAFWEEVRRVLKPGGLFIASCYSWSEIEEGVAQILESSLFKKIEPYPGLLTLILLQLVSADLTRFYFVLQFSHNAIML